MANTYIKRTQVAGDRQKFTFSAWVKRGAIGTNQQILSCYHGNSDSGYIEFRFQGSGDSLHCSGYSTNWFRTTRAFRDTNAWYHIVYAVDTTQSTGGNRMKLYINGEQETVFATASDPSINLNLPFGESGSDIRIGVDVTANAQFFDGSMSHVHFCDGYQYQPSDFGSTDATTGEWKINTSPSVSYGNNGFFILKDGNSVTDQSGQSHNCTVAGGTLTKTEDCPNNVFATWNFLDRYYTQANFSSGNTTVQTPNASETYCTSTLGMSSGKYYMEVMTYDGSNRDNIGIVDSVATANNGSNNLYQKAKGYSYRGVGGVWNNDSQLSGTFASYGSPNTIGVAVDLDNNLIYFSKDGVWQNSADPSSGTGGVSITAAASLTEGSYFFAVGDEVTSDDTTYRANFGNPAYALTSAVADGNGLGQFEYTPPTGFVSLCTNNLNL